MSNEKVYVLGYSKMSDISKKFTELVLERNDFIITENIEISDVVLITNQNSYSKKATDIIDYCSINNIPMAKNLYELCNIRYELELQEV